MEKGGTEESPEETDRYMYIKRGRQRDIAGEWLSKELHSQRWLDLASGLPEIDQLVGLTAFALVGVSSARRTR